MQRNKTLPQDLPSVINSDLGPILLPTNQLATELLSLRVSDTAYLINSCYGFFPFDFLRFDFLAPRLGLELGTCELTVRLLFPSMVDDNQVGRVDECQEKELRKLKQSHVDANVR